MNTNNGDRFDLLADQARVVLDRQLREKGGEDLVRLEHQLRLFDVLLELQQNSHITRCDRVLVEIAQQLRDFLCRYDMPPGCLNKP